jgi:hypothetical protein
MKVGTITAAKYETVLTTHRSETETATTRRQEEMRGGRGVCKKEGEITVGLSCFEQDLRAESSDREHPDNEAV